MLSGLLQLDTHLLIWITSHRIATLNTPVSLISVSGRGGMVWFGIGAALVVGKRISVQRFLQLTLALLMASMLSDQVIKPLVGRQRPFTQVAHLEVLGNKPDGSSFPSGHAATAFAGALVLSRLLPAGQVLWWTLAVVIAFSRVYLGVHYLLDVSAGALIGLICGVAGLKLGPRMRADRRNPMNGRNEPMNRAAGGVV